MARRPSTARKSKKEDESKCNESDEEECDESCEDNGGSGESSDEGIELDDNDQEELNEVVDCLDDEEEDTEIQSNTEEKSQDDDSEEKSKRTVFMKGLDYDLKEDELRVEMEKLGGVARVSIPMTYDGRRNKGFAYVEFEEVETAEKLAERKEMMMMGRKVSLDMAKPRNTKRFYTLFVNNLSYNTGKEELTEYFGKYGELHNISLPMDLEHQDRNKGYCFVEYASEDSIEKVTSVTKHVIQNRTVRINYGDKNERRFSGNKKYSNRGKRDGNDDGLRRKGKRDGFGKRSFDD